MNKNTIRAAFAFMALSVILFGSYSFSGQQYHEFRLGKHSIDGNEIEFTFPMPPPSKSFYLFSYQWKLKKPYKRARLVIKLYGRNKNLVAAGESIWTSMRNDSTHFGYMTFG